MNFECQTLVWQGLGRAFFPICLTVSVDSPEENCSYFFNIHPIKSKESKTPLKTPDFLNKTFSIVEEYVI
jgi:hypothetical protein